MAQGKKYDEEIRTKAFVMLGAGQTRSSVAKALDLPYTTIATWEKQWLKESEKKAQKEKNEALGANCGQSGTPVPTDNGECACPHKESGTPRTSSPTDNAEAHSSSGYEETTVDGMSLVELRQSKKDKFVDDAWRMLDDAKCLLERRLKRALEDEDKLDEILDAFAEMEDEKGNGLSDKALRELYRKFSALKLEDVRALSTVLGTLYDKQALAAKDATQIVGGTIGVLKFEEM